MPKSIVGARIREERRARGVTQADLARQIGISPSYLNLIERNKRGIAGKLLRRVADALAVGIEDLDGAAERRLLEQVREIAADPRLAGLGIEEEEAGELIGRYPGWARALGALGRSERETARLNRALSDRLTHDPFLGEAVHRMLTHTASLRSAAEILTEVPDLDAEHRERFEKILAAESRRLSDVGEALASYFDRAHQAAASVTPADELEALFEARANRFPEIEEAVAGAVPGLAAGDEAALRRHAADAAAEAIETIIGADPAIESEAAAVRARTRLTLYAADALAAPLERFAAAARELKYDFELLSAHLGLSPDRICRRLTSLESGPDRPRFAYLSTNAAGVVTEFLGIPGLAPARYGGACPLWINCRAPAERGRTLRQLAVFPTGLRFVFVARARATAGPGFGATGPHETDMLAMDEREAAMTVYGSASGGPMAPEPVGTSCRICPRETCAHRVADLSPA